ncbi:DUF4226 domain-containing protein [Mycolicibacterium palauense]|uniref:DUF4226 domain-containing protein n=1 Tax=Mycolicibacterium palauense TaxID=2034511 RepID=UPI000BFF17F8|nr:DUF4226 domain-containing protein [Mycolicibacterium palauense]
MSEITELRDSIRRVTEATGDPDAWRRGLSDREIADLSLYPVDPGVASVVLTKLRRDYAGLLAGTAPAPRATTAKDPPQNPEGDTAEAIRSAEHDLAQQRSLAAQLDLHAVTAILGAHSTTVAGAEALSRLQDEIENAVRTRTDLDTPAGARDFQRHLIARLKDIRRVVETADLDSTSRAALMAVWTALYGTANAMEPSSPRGAEPAPDTGESPPPRPRGGDPGAPARLTGTAAAAQDPLWDQVLAGDPLLDALGVAPAAEPPAVAGLPATPVLPLPPSSAPAPVPASPQTPAPSAVPPSSALPVTTPPTTPITARAPGLGEDPLRALEELIGSPDGLDDAVGQDGEHGAQSEQSDSADSAGSAGAADPNRSTAVETPGEEPGPAPSATVRLPDGDTVTAPSAALAEVIRSATSGTPLGEAFQRQGITIPAPGAVPEHPVDPSRLAPGDIGVFIDRHALALGADKALLDNHIQPIGAVSGPTFLGWSHPPDPSTDRPAPAPPPGVSGSSPQPTRPASAGTDS